jgi:tetratricopeptide (TPR) repeat protein
MLDDSRVQQLVEEILESERTPEEVCRDSPELLREVREGWRRLRAIRDQLGLIFPEPGSADDHEPTEPEIGPPKVPGYEVGEVLGRGGVGVVYKAMHLRLHRPVALKMLLAGGFATRAERQRFAREAEVVAGLRHPNIVQVYDVGDLDGRPYFTMEFVEGGSLAERIAGTPRPARQAAELVATLADAIEAAHLGGIVHRDLKPSNVLLSAEGTPKIGDFGLARHLEVGSSLTQSGTAVGTPSYMSPEQARGQSSETGPASDLYALGAVLYELLTGRPPFRAESAAETLHQVITRDPVPPSRLNAKVPKDLETICLKCLRKDPRMRYAGAASLAEDLRRFLSGETIAARPENGLQRLTRRVRRQPAFSAAVATATLLTLSLVGLGTRLAYERDARVRVARAESAEIERAADADLSEMVRWQKASAWTEARAALGRAESRLGRRGSAELRRRLELGRRELALVSRWDALRLERASSVGGNFPEDRTVEESLRAFQEAGLGNEGEAPEVSAGRVKASNIKNALVAMLDESALLARGSRRPGWLADVARLADDDPAGWRDRVRRSANGMDRKALADLAATAPVADQCIPLLIALARYLDAAGGDALPFMTKVQQAHCDDFWVNYELGRMLCKKQNSREAIRYLQAALTIRPRAGLVYNELGLALMHTSRFVEAVVACRKAVEIDPTAGPGHHNLAVALQGLGDYRGAIEQSRIATRYNPKVALVHYRLGVSLEATGEHAEAIAAFREAIKLDPNIRWVREQLRKALIGQKRFEEARGPWAEALAAKPPNHDDWYGYAELCLFLGMEQEYARARQALLDSFGASTDPYIAERTGRACLLRPASEADLARIVALAEHAWGSDRSKDPGGYRHFLFVQGLAEYRLGRLDQAISLMQGEASQVLGPAPRLVLAMALHRSGKVEAARKTLAAAILSHDWTAAKVEDQDGWIFHVLRREAESLILPDLPAFLEGKHQPRDNDERLALLGVCQFTNRHDLMAYLYAEAFATDSRLTDDLRAGHRYKAAREASLTGCGGDEDSARLAEPERRRWREQARQWLRADLANWAKVLDDNPTTAPSVIQATLTAWRSDPDLTGLRDPAELNKRPTDEGKDCLSLWDEVAALGERAARAR